MQAEFFRAKLRIDIPWERVEALAGWETRLRAIHPLSQSGGGGADVESRNEKKEKQDPSLRLRMTNCACRE